jgi:hypothetical protein
VSLARLLRIHAALTLAAGVVLVVAPGLIPGAVGVAVAPPAYLVCYLLGAAELALAVLSFGAARLADPDALRLVAACFVVFHLATAALEVYAFAQGASAAIWVNVAVRTSAAALFAYYGVHRINGTPDQTTPRGGAPAAATAP